MRNDSFCRYRSRNVYSDSCDLLHIDPLFFCFLSDRRRNIRKNCSTFLFRLRGYLPFVKNDSVCVKKTDFDRRSSYTAPKQYFFISSARPFFYPRVCETPVCLSPAFSASSRHALLYAAVQFLRSIVLPSSSVCDLQPQTLR